jgi:hypothetical protein
MPYWMREAKYRPVSRERESSAGALDSVSRLNNEGGTVRRFWIHHILPVAFCAMPVLAAVLLFAAIPPDARADYLERITHSPIDWLILSLGTVLFAAQTILAWRALRWREVSFDERPDKWLENLAQAAEWFPLLGLIGTVAAILQTFSSITPGSNPSPSEIIRKYAPAITATGSGLFMAFINILPQWVVRVGRDLIRSLAGAPAPMVPLTPADAPPTATDRVTVARGGAP